MKANRIDISARKLSILATEERQEILTELQDLITNDLDTVMQLDDYCLNRNNKPNQRVRKVLIAKGILNADGTLPDPTNEAMYELRTGHSPYWLKKAPPQT